jgi:hypothetical protein
MILLKIPQIMIRSGFVEMKPKKRSLGVVMRRGQWSTLFYKFCASGVRGGGFQTIFRQTRRSTHHPFS